ncbi:MAG: spore germination protein, partial [Defluviitaleaceae bacterium]|nr:spore germination protein [Defluviitaleaceae bacterium]
TEEADIEKILAAILSGDTAVIVDHSDKAVILSSKGFPNRGVPTADTEVVVWGSNESFSEVFRINTALIRRRIRDTRLKVKQMRVGRRGKNDICLMYLDDVVRKEILDETIARIENIDIDAILDAGALEEFIEDDWRSPFPQCQITERPDKASSAILEGRIAILTDNSPLALIVPCALNSFFQASEDYTQGWDIVSMIRALRFVAAFLALTLPGLYIAVTTFHPNMLPMLLIFKMAAARENIPFPAVLEILIMEFAFELLREAGIRLPGPVGSSIGIVGGLIVGEAAVSAGIVSPIVVIIVALTGIASFAIPNYSLVSAFRLGKFLIIALSAALGLFGFWAAMLIILIHLASLKSFGIPYLFPFASGGLNDYSDFKDSIFRLPLMFMKKRPIYANPNQTCRLNTDKIGNHHFRE